MGRSYSFQSQRLPADGGIVIGPILFILAILALLAGVLAAGSGGFNTASVADRVAADIQSQANLIRTKIAECNLIRGSGGTNYYPVSDVSNGTLVSALDCAGDPTGQKNLWTGARNTMLPPPTQGFNDWKYINTDSTGTAAATGGRCIWTTPVGSNPQGDRGIVEGLSKAASKFTNSSGFSSSSEVIYDPSSTSQKFVLWITLPSGAADSHCLP